LGGRRGMRLLVGFGLSMRRRVGKDGVLMLRCVFISLLFSLNNSPLTDHLFCDFVIKQAETDGTLLASSPAHQILDSLAAKHWAIKLASEAACSVLSVDSIIMSKPAGGPKVPQQAGNWDED
jgi:hypothetical protein